jgi:hypothetical protein
LSPQPPNLLTSKEEAMPTSRSALTLAVAACCALLLTPAPSLAADGKVEGVVVIDGKPLDAGKVFFHLDSGEFVGAKVKDGKYAVSRVPAGKRKVAAEGKGVPAKYGSEETSGLTLEVKEGARTFDVELRSR